MEGKGAKEEIIKQNAEQSSSFHPLVMPQTHSTCENGELRVVLTLISQAVNKWCPKSCRHRPRHTPAAQTRAAGKGHIRIPNQAQTLQKNPAQINNIWNLCPLLFVHYGSFVGFSPGFNEATVLRKGGKKEEKRNSKKKGKRDTRYRS